MSVARRVASLDEVPAGHPKLVEFDGTRIVLARVGEEFFHEVILEEVTLEEKIALIEGELAAHGRVLFRDLIERFGGAVPDEIDALLEALRAEQGAALIIATHDARVAARARRVLELVDGQVSSS